MADKAWVTLATNDTYALGALVLAHSLKKVNTAYKLVVLVSSNVTFAMRGTLQSIYDEVKEVNILDSGDAENLRLLARPELGITFTKLHCWKLTQYEKCVFLDADTLVLQNCDELFEREELSAAPDVGWPDCFNSGVFVFKPSEKTFKELYDFAIANGSFDGGDQGLLNMFFSSWATSDASKRLPFLYNLSSAAIYSYLPAFKWYGKGVKIVHFIGNSKPWTQPFNSSTRTVEAAPGASHLQNFLQYWWDLFCACVYTQLSPEMTRLLLRSWYTPHITIKNNPSRNNPMHSEVYIPEIFVTPEIEEHFIFTDPWDEFEKNIAASVESSDNIYVTGYSSNDNEKSHNEIVHYEPYKDESHVLNEYQPPVYHYEPPIHNDYHNDAHNNYQPAVSDQKFIESAPVYCQNSVEVCNAPIIHTQPNFTNCDNSNYSSNDNQQNCEVEQINVNNETCIIDDISHDSDQNFCSCDTPVNNNYSSLHSLKHEILQEENHYSETKNETNDDAGLANSLSQMVLEEPTPEQKAREDFLRRQNWEQGNIDYMGKDSFSNIWEKISQTINPELESKAEEKVPVVESSSTSPATSEQPSQPPVLQICPIKPPTSSQPSEEPISCPKPPKPAATEPATPSQPVAVSTPPATVVEKPATEPAAPVCSKTADASPVCQKPVAPKEAPVPTPADASPVCQKPVAPKEAPVPTPAEASPVCQKPVAPVPTPAEASPVCQKPVAPKVAPVPTPAEASPVCQKPVAPKETTESVKAKVEQPAAPVAKSSQEVKSAPEQDPKTKTAAKPSPSKK